MRIKTSSLYKVLWWYNNVTLLLPLLMREDNLTQGLQKVTCQERLNTDSRIMRKLPMLSLTLMIIVLEFCPFLCCMSGEMLLYEHLDQPAGAAGTARRILWPARLAAPPHPLWATWLHNCDITPITPSYSLDNLSPEPCEGLSISPGTLARYSLHVKQAPAPTTLTKWVQKMDMWKWNYRWTFSHLMAAFYV